MSTGNRFRAGSLNRSVPPAAVPRSSACAVPLSAPRLPHRRSLAVVLTGSSSAVAAPGDPAPGSPAYLARDAQNIADAYGRQTAPDGQLSPAYGWPSAQYIDPRRRRRPAGPGGRRPTARRSRPARSCRAGTSATPTARTGTAPAARCTPVSFTNRYGALLHGDVFAPLPGARDPYTGKALEGPFPGVVHHDRLGPGHRADVLVAGRGPRRARLRRPDLRRAGAGPQRDASRTRATVDGPARTATSLAAPPAGEQSGCPGVPSQQTSNFVYGTEDAIDFFLSTPSRAVRATRRPASAHGRRLQPALAAVRPLPRPGAP